MELIANEWLFTESKYGRLYQKECLQLYQRCEISDNGKLTLICGGCEELIDGN